MRTKKIYLASSWRNVYQQTYVEWLRNLGVSKVRNLEVYDFKNPNGNTGFSWDQLDLEWREWSTTAYVHALNSKLSIEGFASDFEAMAWADTCIMLMPCGNSASLELGWCAGAGKKTIIHFPELKTNPDLMVKMATHITTNLTELYRALAE